MALIDSLARLEPSFAQAATSIANAMLGLRQLRYQNAIQMAKLKLSKEEADREFAQRVFETQQRLDLLKKQVGLQEREVQLREALPKARELASAEELAAQFGIAVSPRESQEAQMAIFTPTREDDRIAKEFRAELLSRVSQIAKARQRVSEGIQLTRIFDPSSVQEFLKDRDFSKLQLREDFLLRLAGSRVGGRRGRAPVRLTSEQIVMAQRAIKKFLATNPAWQNMKHKPSMDDIFERKLNPDQLKYITDVADTPEGRRMIAAFDAYAQVRNLSGIASLEYTGQVPQGLTEEMLPSTWIFGIKDREKRKAAPGVPSPSVIPDMGEREPTDKEVRQWLDFAKRLRELQEQK